MQSFDLTAVDLSAVLNSAPGGPAGGPSAAVAVVFRMGAQGTELLFIQRATKDTDPWSGHMAFPGGRTESIDIDSYDTAERETLEEVDLDLAAVPRLGVLDDLEPGRQRNGLWAVHANAYWLEGEAPDLVANYEVADILWVPLAVLGDRSRYIEYYYAASDSSWPGIQLDEPSQVVWGLTLRFLADLFTRIDRPFIQLAPWPTTD